jgi:VWFA-related protein
MRRHLAVMAAFGIVAALDHAAIRGQAPSSAASQSYNTATTAILVDVVVRDRKDHPIVDLDASDFELLEDDVPQKIDSFTRISRGGGIGIGVRWRSPATSVVTAASPEPTPLAPGDPAAEATTALVFDHLSSESLRLAQKATLDYVPMNGTSDVRLAVFATDPGVRMLQGYTTDRARVRQAVAAVMPSGTSAREQQAERRDEVVDRRRQLIGESDQLAAAAAGGSGAALARNAAEMGERENERKLLETELAMMGAFDSMDRERKGYDTTASLMAVVHTMLDMPGRKTVVYFSEGLPVTPVMSAQLDRMIDVCNRSNVTVYAVDAKGLRARSTLLENRKTIDELGEERLQQVASGSDRSTQPLMLQFERVEDMMKLDSRVGLAKLAEDTGGFLVEGSNDLTPAFRRIDEDHQFHYLLTYSPTNTSFDGKFRSIAVKVRRPGAQVFARKGYRATRAPGTIGPSFEEPAVALLSGKQLPNAFPIRAAGFSFPDPARPGLAPVVVRVGTESLAFSIDRQRHTYSAQAAVVVRIRDAQGREVQRVSQQYVLTGEDTQVDAAKKGEILFYRQPDLPAGLYTVESIVVDAVANQASARVATLTVPDAGTHGLGMSSLVIVSRVEDTGEAVKSDSHSAPFYVGSQLLYPNVGEPVKKSATSELPFYFTLYGEAASRAKAAVQLLRNGSVLAEAPVDLPASTGSRVQHVGKLPIGALPAGTYQLRIAVSEGPRQLTRTAFFTLVE